MLKKPLLYSKIERLIFLREIEKELIKGFLNIKNKHLVKHHILRFEVQK